VLVMVGVGGGGGAELGLEGLVGVRGGLAGVGGRDVGGADDGGEVGRVHFGGVGGEVGVGDFLDAGVLGHIGG